MSSESTLVVVDRAGELPPEVAGAKVLTATSYLSDDTPFAHGTRVINLCRYDRYQSDGYYVSLLAEARGHVSLPEMRLLGDLQGDPPTTLTDDPAFGDLVQTELAAHPRKTYTLDAIFGVDPLHGHDELAAEVFTRLHAPAMRVGFVKRKNRWHVARARARVLGDLSVNERSLLVAELASYLGRTEPRTATKAHAPSPSLAILYNADAPNPPSNAAALRKFKDIGEALGMRVALLRKDEIHRLAEFSALFIRDTTNVDHYTYDFARRAVDLGLVVIDDPDSILKCTNKVFLHELLARHQVLVPRTVVVHQRSRGSVVSALGLPCVLKQPDSAFSLGVFKVETVEALEQALSALFARSKLVLAQEWLPTTFDWRVGVLDRRAIYVCKYFMAPGHWQVVKHEQKRRVEGSTAAMTVGEAPRAVLDAALAAANLIGDGLYGVDIKESGGKCYVMEVNDNPNIDAGNEDAVSKDVLYREILGVILRRIREGVAVKDA